jgi:hypothetical protein
MKITPRARDRADHPPRARHMDAIRRSTIIRINNEDIDNNDADNNEYMTIVVVLHGSSWHVVVR